MKILLIVVVVAVALAMFRNRGAAEPVRVVELDALGSSEVEALLRAGRKLEAIKACRLASGCRLVEAKHYVERMQQRLGI